MAENQTESNSLNLLKLPPLHNLIAVALSIFIGGTATGGFILNSNQWSDVAAELKAVRQELGDLKIKLILVERNAESTKALEMSLREHRDRLASLEKQVMEMGFKLKEPNRQ